MTRKTALITGCSNDGIGSGFALALQAKDVHVFATARDPSKMSSLSALPHVTMLKLDVTSAADVAAAVKAVEAATGGKLDYLINNAGHNHFMPVLDDDLDTLRALWEVNVWGPLAVTKAFAPLIINAKGLLVYVTSIAGHVNTAWMGSYSATKRSLEIMAETLRVEVAPFGVGVLSVVTGSVRTQGQAYFEDLRVPEESLYKPLEDNIRARAQGTQGIEKMSLQEYSEVATAAILSRQTGRIWAGAMAERTRDAVMGPVPQDMMDTWSIMGTGLDQLNRE